MNFIDVFYLSDDGLRLYARDYPGPSAAAPVLLCLPGLTRNSKDFADFACRHQATHRVICPDQRGRGRSMRDHEPANYRPDRYAQDMLRLLDLLGVPEVILVGTSLGGLMSLILMATAPARVKAVVINDIGPEVDPAGLARIAGYVGKTRPATDWASAAAQTRAINEAAFPDYTDADWHAMARELYVQMEMAPVLDYDPAIAQGVADGSAGASLWLLVQDCAPKPMLVVRGERSDILSAATVEKMRAWMPGLTAVTVPRVGHAPTLREPAAREAVEAFLKGLA